jgi:hypothetical protein
LGVSEGRGVSLGSLEEPPSSSALGSGEDTPSSDVSGDSSGEAVGVDPP